MCEAAGSIGIQPAQLRRRSGWSADFYQFELFETLKLHITTCFFSFQLNKIKEPPIKSVWYYLILHFSYEKCVPLLCSYENTFKRQQYYDSIYILVANGRSGSNFPLLTILPLLQQGHIRGSLPVNLNNNSSHLSAAFSQLAIDTF